MKESTSDQKTAGGKILRNSFWYGLETIVETLVFLSTSIAVARYLGPEKLGRYSYISFFVSVVTRTSGTGLASATRKYMSEFLAMGKLGEARAVYNLAYRYQLLGTILLTVLGLAAAFLFGDKDFRLVSTLLILSIIPGVMSWVPANANLAFEDMSKNTFSALCYIVVSTVITVLTIVFHWDLVGIASAMLLGRIAEMITRTIPLHKRLRAMPLATFDPEVTARIRKFCLEAIGLQLLFSVVWDRSEMIFLRHFSGLEQIAFYSVSFGLAGNLLLVPRTFGGATGVTLMVESGRDASRVDSIIKNASRYLLFITLPIHLGAIAITREAVGLAYGAKYAGAVPVLMIAAGLAIPRAFQELPEMLIKSADRQKRLLLWFSLTGVLNIALDALLIPRYNAVGAAWANGLAQTFGIIAIWMQARRFYKFGFPLLDALRLLAASGVMAVIAYFMAKSIPGFFGTALAVVVALPVYILMVKLFSGLHASDRERLAPIGNRLPGFAQSLFEGTVRFLTPSA